MRVEAAAGDDEDVRLALDDPEQLAQRQRRAEADDLARAAKVEDRADEATSGESEPSARVANMAIGAQTSAQTP